MKSCGCVDTYGRHRIFLKHSVAGVADAAFLASMMFCFGKSDRDAVDSFCGAAAGSSVPASRPDSTQAPNDGR